MFCPNCGANTISQFPSNRKLADFECKSCAEEYELKAQKSAFGRKVLDGAYGAKLERLASANNPSLFLMNYDPNALGVVNLSVVPKHFFTSDIIEPRKPLSQTARRAGWQGSYIRLDGIPATGKIKLVENGSLVPRIRSQQLAQDAVSSRRRQQRQRMASKCDAMRRDAEAPGVHTRRRLFF
jgi:type II restriction enzyme